MDITDEEFEKLFSGAFKDREEYKAEIKEPYTIADAIHLCMMRGELNMAESLYNKLAFKDKTRFYPDWLEFMNRRRAK